MLVYLLENAVNGKGYVGQHQGYDLSKRWNPRLTNCPSNPHLQASIKKYGPQVFRRKVLAYASCQQELDLLERYFILIYQTTDRRFGYNMQWGGRLWHGGHTQETRKKIGETQKRTWEGKSPEQKTRRSEVARLVWQRRSPEELAALSDKAWLAWHRKSEREIAAMRQKVSASMHLMWERRKAAGFKLEPYTEERKRRISEGVRRYWANRRAAMIKQPATGTKVQKQALKAKEARASAALREVEQAKVQLREIQKRLGELKFELRGGCNW